MRLIKREEILVLKDVNDKIRIGIPRNNGFYELSPAYPTRTVAMEAFGKFLSRRIWPEWNEETSSLSFDEIKPKVELTGHDGNAFNILGRCARAARQAGWSPEKAKVVFDEMRAGDYNHLLQIAMKHFDVE